MNLTKSYCKRNVHTREAYFSIIVLWKDRELRPVEISWVTFLKTSTWCDVPPFRSGPSLDKVLHANQLILHFDPQLLGFWVVIISLMVLPEGALLVCLSHQVWPASEEQMLQQTSTHESGKCWMHINVYCWGKNWVFKGLICIATATGVLRI